MEYKVFEISSKMAYRGVSLVAAETVEEANKIIKEFKDSDPKNESDSWGYGEVENWNEIDDLFSKRKGIIYRGIYYSG